MLRWLFLFISLAICACSGENPVAETNTVTNGKHVLGIVPLRGGASEQDQRYRLLVCKALPRYSAEMFADPNICRSALLTEDGQEVDFVGNKLHTEHKNIIHLEAMSASEVRELGQSPITEKRRGAAKFYGLGGLAIALGVAKLGYISSIDNMSNVPSSTFSRVLSHSLRIATIGIIGFGTFIIVGAVNLSMRNAKSKERRERIGDDAGRVYPLYPMSRYHRSSGLKVDPADLLTHQNWRAISQADFHKVAKLPYEGNLRAILVTMARFFKLEVNESALQL